jgi:hypothetical protein
MRASTSILSRYASRLFTGGRATGSLRRANLPSRRRAIAPVYAAAEILEERVLLSATASFGSALGVGSTGNDIARGVTTDKSGNTYVTGEFSGTVNFNPNGTAVNLTSRGGNDAFVAKYTNNALVWVQQIGNAWGQNVQVDTSGNVYVAGEFGGSHVQVGTSNIYLTSAGGNDGFVAKLTQSGTGQSSTFQWAKSWGTSANDNATGLGVDSSGNVYALGSVLGGGYTILKYSPTGAADWSESIAANEQMASAGGLAVSPSGNVFVGGDFEGTVNFNPSGRADNISSGPAYSGFVLELSTSGKLDWVSPFVGQVTGSTGGYSAVTAVALDSSGNIDVGGTYGNSVDFNPHGTLTTLPTPIGDWNGFVVQLNSSGGLNWAQALETAQSASYVMLFGLTVDSAGNVYATGTFAGTIDLDPGSNPDTQIYTAAAATNAYVVSLSATGTFDLGGTFGGAGRAVPLGIAVDTSGNVDIVGYYDNTVNFNPNPNGTPEDLTSAGSGDIFVLQLQQS